MKNVPGSKRQKDLTVTRSILIVDEEEAIRESVSYILREEGYACTSVSGGREAIELTKNQLFDALLIDYHLPKMDGIKALSEIKKLNPKVAIVLITCYSDADMIDEAMRAGAEHYLLKPLDFDDLVELVHSLLQ